MPRQRWTRGRDLTRRTSASALVLALGAALLSMVVVAPPAAAEPSMTVTPDVDVVHDTQVTINGAGFTAGFDAASILCSSAVVDSLDPADCDLGMNAQGVIEADGTIELLMRVRRFPVIRGEPHDCAVADACQMILVAGPNLGGFVYEEAAGVPIVFDPAFPEPPPEIEWSVGAVTGQVATVTADCSAPTDIDLTAAILQRRRQPPLATRVRTEGQRRFRCDGETTVDMPLVPRHGTKASGRRLFPMRSLLPGVATLRLTYRAVSGEYDWTDVARRQIDVVDPALSARLTVDHPRVQVRLLDVRVSIPGGAFADVEVTCNGVDEVHVDGRAVARIAPDTYRATIAESSTVACTGTPQSVVLALNQTVHRQRDDIVPAGEVEVFITAGRRAGETDAADFVPITTERVMRPRSIRVRHHPRARIDIGDVTTDGVAATFRCKRDARFTVVATLGQPIDTIVLNDRGVTTMRCSEGDAVAFEVRWEGRIIRPDVHSAVTVRAINGIRPNWTGKFQQNQGARRTVQAAG